MRARGHTHKDGCWEGTGQGTLLDRTMRQQKMGQREVEAHSNKVGDRWKRLTELRNAGGVTDVQDAAKQGPGGGSAGLKQPRTAVMRHRQAIKKVREQRNGLMWSLQMILRGMTTMWLEVNTFANMTAIAGLWLRLQQPVRPWRPHLKWGSYECVSE